MAETKITGNMEELESVVRERDDLKAKLDATTNELEQYKVAYREQLDKYGRLFGLFANNVDYYIAGKTNN